MPLIDLPVVSRLSEDLAHSARPRPKRRRLAVAAVAAGCAWLLVAVSPASAHDPAASFTYVPQAPAAGELVAFQSTTTSVPEHTEPLTLAWDLDSDGEFDDATGGTARRSFAVGSHVVRLRARYSPGHESVAQETIQVGGNPAPTPTPEPTPSPQPTPAPAANQAPVAALDRDCGKVGMFVLCAGLFAREQKPHTIDASPSRDPDGSIVRYEWDLDGTGGFEIDTGATPTVTHTFERFKGLVDARKRPVRVRVTDDDGAAAESAMTLSLLEPGCEPLVTRGRLRATGLCLRPRKIEVDGHKVVRWYSEHPVTVNGITIDPAANRLVLIELPDEAGAPAPKIASAGAVVTVAAPGGAVKLVDGRLEWRLSDGAHLAGFTLDPAARLNGLRVTGLASAPELATGGASSTVRLHVALPAQFDDATSDDPVVLRPGAAVSSASEPLKFEVAGANIGPLMLEKLVVSFDGEDLWEIAASIQLPPPIPYKVSGDAGIRGGEFEHAGAEVDFRPIGGVGPFGPVYLQRIAFRVEVNPKNNSKCVPKVGIETIDMQKLLQQFMGEDFRVPKGWTRYLVIDHGIPTFALCGEVGLTGGPTVLGASAIRLDAGLGLATYRDRPAVFRAFGKLYLVEIPLAEAELEVHTNGYARAQARFNWGIDGLASLKGGLLFEMQMPKFNAQASVEACLEFVDWCAGAKAVVSSRGVAACLKIDVLVDDWEPGFGWRWGHAPDLYFAGCDIGPYKEHIDSPLNEHITAVPARARARAAGFEQTIDLPAGLPGATVVAKGQGAPPKITLIGPKGERITSPDDLRPVEQAPFFVMKDPRANLTQFAISKPSAGRWRVMVEEGSAPVVSIASANGLESPKIDAKVVGHGHRRAVKYRVKPVVGQKVTFIERGPSAGRRIGDTTGARGRLAFRPAPGAAERRKIVALVSQDGQPRGEYEVGRYQAPAVQRPSRPRALRVQRRGTSLRIAWKASRPADVQQATVWLSDGRRLVRRTRKTTLAVRGVRRGVRATVQLRGVLSTGIVGRPATARIGRKAGGRRHP